MQMQLVLNSEVRTLSDENIRKIYGFQKDDDLHEVKQLILRTIHELELPSSFTLDDLHRCRKKVHTSHFLNELESDSIKNDLFIKHILLQLFPEVHHIPLPDMNTVSSIFKHEIGIATYTNTDVEFSFKCPQKHYENIIHQFEAKDLKIIKTDIQHLKNEDVFVVHVKVERFSLDNFNRHISQHLMSKKIEKKF
jgi:hypothetical protein